ncbi:hypothetical protein [Chengkuizengella axinellae]|uniref:DUF4179 domain-containing protein n=1 Tax=Chengkuizengella axinellae TaxID=3064388 RepID=A0ABT9IXW6_9BACL|nr:hypothetical protein [Chengkuizengella sp. 2205SS18-9]MDP5274209.1 hypothetical protein [Chengkuizengella sp. 2205SS18-9]
MDKKNLYELQKEYKEIQIPSELNNVVQTGIERGRTKMNKRSSNKFLNICASFVLGLALLTASVNLSPTFGQSLENIPYMGQLVKVLQFNNGKSDGGTITDGSDISGLDSFEKDGYENIVINFSQGDMLQSDVPAYEVRYDEIPYAMTLEICGARNFSAEEDFNKILESEYVKDIYKLVTFDDSCMRFVIEFDRPVEYKIEERKDPASLVISLKEDEKVEEKKIYSLRTESYVKGFFAASSEEKLYTIGYDKSRVLKDESGLFYIEIQSFETKEEAEQELEELSKATDIKMLIEERTGVQEPQSFPSE